MNLESYKFSCVVICIELIIFIIFILLSQYNSDADGSHVKHSLIPAFGGKLPKDNSISRFDPRKKYQKIKERNITELEIVVE